MIGAPGYSLDEPVVLGDLTLLPRSFRWQSDDVGVDEVTIVNETQRGVRTEYELFSRDVLPGLIFRFPASEYADFKTFIEATRAVSFWFVPDSTVMAGKVNVRRQVVFLPKNIGQPGAYQGDMQRWYDFTLVLTVEVDDIAIED